MMKKRRGLLASRVITNADNPVGVPSIVAEAMRVDFGASVTGYLCCTAFEGYHAIGIVFQDLFGRFDNGHGIRTSNVLSKTVVKGYVVIETLNSRYVICGWAHDESGPRFTGRLH